MINPFFNKDITSIRDFSRSDIEHLFFFSDKLQSLSFQERKKIAEGKILGLIFFEPSTRTRLSFEAAMHTIGGESISIIEPRTSSTEKGENLHDTIKTFESYADIIVLRHHNEGAARYAAQIAIKPVINGGSGSEEHPTQAMLDMYTILKEKGNLSNLKIALMGDLKYSRTIHSLLFGLVNFNCRIFLVSPPELQIREDIFINIEGKSNISQHKEIEEIIREIDVIYVTRIQKERFPDPLDYEKVRGSYSIDNNLLINGKEDLMVMHPLPRTNEIKYEVDTTPRAKYFIQTYYGKIVRSALLALMLNREI